MSLLPLLRPLRSPKLSKSNGPIKLSYNGPMLSGSADGSIRVSEYPIRLSDDPISGSQMTLEARSGYQMALPGSQMALSGS